MRSLGFCEAYIGEVTFSFSTCLWWWEKLHFGCMIHYIRLLSTSVLLHKSLMFKSWLAGYGGKMPTIQYYYFGMLVSWCGLNMVCQCKLSSSHWKSIAPSVSLNILRSWSLWKWRMWNSILWRFCLKVVFLKHVWTVIQRMQQLCANCNENCLPAVHASLNTSSESTAD
jgi:hypothetical protein